MQRCGRVDAGYPIFEIGVVRSQPDDLLDVVRLVRLAFGLCLVDQRLHFGGAGKGLRRLAAALSQETVSYRKTADRSEHENRGHPHPNLLTTTASFLRGRRHSTLVTRAHTANA